MSGTHYGSPDRSLPRTDPEHLAHQGEWTPAILAKVIAEALVYAAESSHDCVYDIIGVEYPNSRREHNQPIHPRLQGRPDITRVLLKCRVCNIPEVQELAGRWTIDQILTETPPGPL